MVGNEMNCPSNNELSAIPPAAYPEEALDRAKRARYSSRHLVPAACDLRPAERASDVNVCRGNCDYSSPVYSDSQTPCAANTSTLSTANPDTGSIPDAPFYPYSLAGAFRYPHLSSICRHPFLSHLSPRRQPMAG